MILDKHYAPFWQKKIQIKKGRFEVKQKEVAEEKEGDNDESLSQSNTIKNHMSSLHSPGPFQ